MYGLHVASKVSSCCCTSCACGGSITVLLYGPSCTGPPTLPIREAPITALRLRHLLTWSRFHSVQADKACVFYQGDLARYVLVFQGSDLIAWEVHLLQLLLPSTRVDSQHVCPEVDCSTDALLKSETPSSVREFCSAATRRQSMPAVMH